MGVEMIKGVGELSAVGLLSGDVGVGQYDL